MLDLTRRLLLGTAAATTLAGRARAQAQPTIRIGVLSDMSGPYRDISGPNCVSAARQAVQDFGTAAGFNVEILQADHQNKADVGLNIARQWFDREGVDAITDVNNSGIGLVAYLCRSDCSFRLLCVRRPGGFCLPTLNACGAGYRSR
jgi:branched-chain amino acid transport system substrate-binding protein